VSDDLIRPPAPAPCGSCPYRLDTPAGVWSADEYDKLPDYDGETWEQPPSVFLCHQQDGCVCAGWAAVHGDVDSFGLRFAVACGAMTPETADATIAYQSPVPLHPTGRAAADFGKGEIEAPSPEAVEMVRKLERKQKRRTRATK
jgi:hypothetical protein